MARRSFLRQLITLPFLGVVHAMADTAPRKPLNIMMKSAWGSDDSTKAAIPFLHGLALSEAGHTVQIFLLGEAVSLMRKSVASAVVPVGWPPLEQTMAKLPNTACRSMPAEHAAARLRWRSPTWTSGAPKNDIPTIFVSVVERTDRVITE